jgi:hypothetical protein
MSRDIVRYAVKLFLFVFELPHLLGMSPGCLILVATLLLVGTALQYLDFIYNGETPTWVVVAVVITSGLPVVWGAVVVVVRTRSLSRKMPNYLAAPASG